MGRIRIGVSGWRYPGWRGTFYPAGLPQRAELEYAARRLTSLEINGTFYSLQRPSSFTAWRAQVPPGFVFAVKGSRFITHMKRLSTAQPLLPNYFASGILALGPALGPVLWQLPPTLAFDEGMLRGFFEQLPRSTAQAARLASEHDERVPADRALTVAEQDRPLRHALEVRHPSWGDEAAQVCREYEVALVVADTGGRWPAFTEPTVPTTDLMYLRLHGPAELYASGYTDRGLAGWADRIRRWAAAGLDVYCYFDNDAKAYAPRDAMRLRAILGV